VPVGTGSRTYPTPIDTYGRRTESGGAPT